MNAAANYSTAALRGGTLSRGHGCFEALLHVQGLHCARCVRRLQQALAPGAQIEVDLPSGSCVLHWRDDPGQLAQCLSAVEAAGFTARLLPVDQAHEAARRQQRLATLRFGIALLFGMQLMMLASSEYFGQVEPAYQGLLRGAQWLLATPVLLFSGWPFLRDGIGALRRRGLTMDTPIALALLAAYTLSVSNTLRGGGEVYFDSVVMFVMLLSLSRHAQARGRLALTDRLRRLAAAQPLTARRIHGHGVEQVAASELRAGDEVLVAPGETLPADGHLCAEAALDESALTGESLPRRYAVGATVRAGTINRGLAELRLRVATGSSLLSQIQEWVRRAQLGSPAEQQLADRVAAVLVPILLSLALLAFALWWPDLGRAITAALAVLVVTCPCALALAAPITQAAAVNRLAGRQVLLCEPDALQRLQGVTDVVFDKTGTLSTGQMRRVRGEALSDFPLSRCIHWAARLEAGLAHPVARALAVDDGVLPAASRRLLDGGGVSGVIEGRRFCLRAADTATAHGEGRWYELRREDKPIARFLLREALRAEAGPLLAKLQQRGLRCHIFSGDQPSAVIGLAQELGISSHLSAQSPRGKLDALQALRTEGGRIVVVGDGINDAPVLAAADVAVSIGSGAALAQAQADVVLLHDDLDRLLELFSVAEQARRVLRQNMVWALSYNAAAVPLAFLGLVAPWLAALGMGGSALLVSLNALRLRGRAASRSLTSPTPEQLALA